MGIYYWAGVYMGMNYEYRSVQTGSVTRYDQVTGEPHEKPTFGSKRVLTMTGTGLNITVPEIVKPEDDTLYDQYQDQLNHGADNGMFGVLIGKTVERNEWALLDFDAMRHARWTLQQSMEKFFPHEQPFVDMVVANAQLQVSMIGA